MLPLKALPVVADNVLRNILFQIGHVISSIKSVPTNYELEAIFCIDVVVHMMEAIRSSGMGRQMLMICSLSLGGSCSLLGLTLM